MCIRDSRVGRDDGECARASRPDHPARTNSLIFAAIEQHGGDWRPGAPAGRDVIGADLKNETHGPATWGTGGPTDWRRAAERAGRQGIAPVLVGEWGGREVGLDTVEGRRRRQFMDYSRARGSRGPTGR